MRNFHYGIAQNKKDALKNLEQTVNYVEFDSWVLDLKYGRFAKF
jgi:hypothetical protein